MSRSQASPPSGNARAAAAQLLSRIEGDDAYANLVLASAELPDGDAGFITELVYGVTRMRRALDHLIDGFVSRPPALAIRNLLRVGAYQLHFMDTPAYAAVSETVQAAPRRQRGFVNAVLRQVAATEPAWPNDATALSYPDWLVERLEHDLGAPVAHAALARMNRPPAVTTRPDGYIQDRASQWVAELVGPQPGERVLDMCAGPGGKATAMAGSSGTAYAGSSGTACAGSRATVVAADRRRHRAALVADNAARTGVAITGATAAADNAARTGAARTGAGLAGVVVADGRHSPFRPDTFDRVLVDAPCSGLGVLGRRADARWRVKPQDVTELARLQTELVLAAFDLVRPGGTVIYSVCTMTTAETSAIDEAVARERPGAEAIPIGDDRWRRWGRGGLICPQDHNTDGMFAVIYRTPVS